MEDQDQLRRNPTLWRPEHQAVAEARALPDSADAQRKEFTRIIDSHGFNFWIYLVAMTGFLTDSYNLFAPNVILPCLAYVYWDGQQGGSNLEEIQLNIVTLLGSAVGQVSFGILADALGRQRLYGVELVIVMFTTVGLAGAAVGVVNLVTGATSMQITGWLYAWRFVMGIGVGAEYPLSACITAEWSSKHTRGRMLSAVFLMQPLGQFFANIIGLAFLRGMKRPYSLDANGANSVLGIDKLWRIVIGFGAVPPIVAIIFRWTIPESGRYIFDVTKGADKLSKAKRATRWVYSPRNVPQAHVPMQEFGPRENGSAAPHSRVGRSSAMQYNAVDQQDHAQSGPDALYTENGDNHPEDQNTSTAPGPPPIDNSTHAPAGVTSLANAQGDFDDFEPSWRQLWKMWTQEWVRIKDYFFVDGNIIHLLGSAMCWFCVDLAFYGLSLNGPGTEGGLWANATQITDLMSDWLVSTTVTPPFLLNCTQTVPDFTTFFNDNISFPSIYGCTGASNSSATTGTPSWLRNSPATNPGFYSIYWVLYKNIEESLITVCAPSLVGSICLLICINDIDRRQTLVGTFFALFLLLVTLGVSVLTLERTSGHIWLIIAYMLAQWLFAFGPNTLTFIIPAEIFPTRWRCTCHGISAAAGKLGAVFAQVAYLTWAHGGLRENPNSRSLGSLIILYAVFMLVGAVFAWAWIPSLQVSRWVRPQRIEAGDDATRPVQYRRGYHQRRNRTLEQLAKSRLKVTEDERTGFLNRWKSTVIWFRERWNDRGTQGESDTESDD